MHEALGDLVLFIDDDSYPVEGGENFWWRLLKASCAMRRRWPC